LTTVTVVCACVRIVVSILIVVIVVIVYPGGVIGKDRHDARQLVRV
jgi:hypothetical protein